MQGGLGLKFLEGDRRAIDAAWAALERTLPFVEPLPEADFALTVDADVRKVLVDLDSIGWAAPAEVRDEQNGRP